VPGLDEMLLPVRAAFVRGDVSPKGKIVTVDGHDRIEPSNAELARARGLTADENALACVVAAEAGGLPSPYGLCIAEIVLREAATRGTTVAALVTGIGKNKGYCGEQRTRWCSSRANPRIWHLEVARVAMRHRAFNLSRGARRWVGLRVMDRGLQNGKPLSYDAEGILRKWGAEGWEWVGEIHHPDTGEWLIDPYLQCMLRHAGKGKADIDRGLRMVAAARARNGRGGPFGEAAEESGRHEDVAVGVAAGAAVIAGVAIAKPALAAHVVARLKGLWR
jgi:hypothetical protein